MPSKLKFLLLALALLCVVMLVAGLAYQRHLRFLITNHSGAPAPAKEIPFPTDAVPFDRALTIDGVRMPFAEHEITQIKTYPPRPSVHLSLQSGVKITLHVPQANDYKIKYFDDQLAIYTASRNQFRWSMTSDEVNSLDECIQSLHGFSEVSHIGIRREPNWTRLVKVYPKMTLVELEWVTSDETWNGVLQAHFKDAPAYANDLDKQIEFMSQLLLEKPPTGSFEEELKALIERVRTKNPAAIIEASVKK